LSRKAFLFSSALDCIYETVRFVKTQIIFNGSLTLIEEGFFETNHAARLNRRLDQSGFDVNVL
jgi:hypothetical protein